VVCLIFPLACSDCNQLFVIDSTVLLHIRTVEDASVGCIQMSDFPVKLVLGLALCAPLLGSGERKYKSLCSPSIYSPVWLLLLTLPRDEIFALLSLFCLSQWQLLEVVMDLGCQVQF
jgi:hypothetical protein